MGGFWDSELGEVTGKAEDAFAKSFKQIPDGTMALAKIQSFKVVTNASDDDFRYLEVVWLLTEGDFKGQKVNQKLKVFGGSQYDKDSAKTKHRALNMFKLLYQLFGMKPKHASEPTDQDLASFVDKAAGLKIRETEPNSEGKQYNWVSEVHEARGFKCETGISIVVSHTNTPPPSVFGGIESAFSRNSMNVASLDDVPF